MLKKSALLFLILVHTFHVFSQSSDPVVLSYQRNFIRAGISTKYELLNDASLITSVNMTPLFIDALAFVKNSWILLGTDSQLMDLASIAAAKSAQNRDVSILPVLRDVFVTITEPRVRTASLNAFAVLFGGRKEDTAFLNEWFVEQLRKGPSDPAFDAKTLAVCAQTLGKIGDASSFAVLFEAAVSARDSLLAQASAAALNALQDGYTEQILAKMDGKRLQDTYPAFSFAMRKEGLPAADRGRIAAQAFALAVEEKGETGSDREQLAALAGEALAELTALKWAQASPVVVKYFYLRQGDYKNDRSNVDALVPVVRCMGAMGTTESAQALSIFLGLLNSDTEQKKNYNEQLMLAVIQALGDLGDKSAFDYLLYVGYLDYPETVKKASRDALARLEW